MGKFLFVLAALIALVVLAGLAYFSLAAAMGAKPAGERAARIRASPNFRDGKFQNLIPTDMALSARDMLQVSWAMLTGGQDREPRGAIPTVPFDRAAWDALPDTGIALAWFGHSTLLLKVDGVTFLTDPVFAERASPFSFAGPKRFAYSAPMRLDLLPRVDLVLLSHDHFDHLDAAAIARLRHLRFAAPLGVGAHLERWGVPAANITELDWWEGMRAGGVDLTFAPARHFSGRSLTGRFGTLWGSWALRGGGASVYFGADSGYSPSFKEVGGRLGPFDLALLECGAYNAHWADIHMFPEQTAQAALDVRARVLMPIHWAKFSLALHPWREPVERLSVKAAELGVALCTPRIGRIVHLPETQADGRWWEHLP